MKNYPRGIQEAVGYAPRALRDAAINLYGAYLRTRRFDKNFWRAYRVLVENEYQSLEWHRERQEQAFLQLIDHAWTRVPFYRQLYEEHGIRRAQIHGLGDIRRLPVITRDDIRNNWRQLVASGLKPREGVVHCTSGTTGEKLRFVVSPRLQWTIKTAQLYRTYAWAGVGPFERRVTLGGRRFCAREPYWVFNRFENQLLLSVHHLSPSTIDEYARKIQEFRPVFVQGHPSAIALVARYALEVPNRRTRLRAVFTTGETMLPEQRECIQEAFGALVVDCYGHGEGAAFASQCCEGTGYHELSESSIIELDRGNGALPGESARIIATSLQNYAMPFIRYDTGDRAVPAAVRRCGCGRGLALVMETVIGRIDDRIVLSPRGDFILPVVARGHLKRCVGVGQAYQLIQDDYDAFTLRLVGVWNDGQRESICEALKDMVGHRCRVTTERIGWSEMRSKGGKVRVIQSRVGEGASGCQ
jgi:phenylacetate-CoA ligase